MNFKQSDQPMSHAESISQLIEDCLAAEGCGFKDLQAVAVSDGPGSYTGLRIGASVAKGICFALDIPLIKISTLKALAWAVIEKEPGFSGQIWPMIDARRMEVYHTMYSTSMEQLMPVNNGIIDLPGFCPEVTYERILLCGDGAEKASKHLNLKDVGIVQHAMHLRAPAQEAFLNADFTDAAVYEPFYFKQANITGPLA